MSWSGFKFSDKSRERIRILNKEKNILRKRPVLQICLDSGKVLNKFPSAKESGFKGVGKVLYGCGSYQSNGFYWIFEDQYENFDFNKYSTYLKNVYNKHLKHPRFIVLDLETGIYYDGIKEVAKAIGKNEKQYAHFTVEIKTKDEYKNRFIITSND